MTTFFCAEEISSKKSSVFESWGKTIPQKTKATALETYFGLGKSYDTKKREAKVKATATIRFPPNNYFYVDENSQRRRIHCSLKERYNWRRKLRDTCLDILGLRLELEKAVKCLYNTNIWNLLWAPFIRSKICLCFSDVFIAILATQIVKT